MDAGPVNDVIGTASQFWSDELDWVGGNTGRTRAAFIAGNRRTQIDFGSSGVWRSRHMLSRSLDVL
jgi:hypothetical protein